MRALAHGMAAVLALAWLMCSSAGIGAEKDADVTEDLVEANALVQQKQYDKAIARFEEILARLPIDSPNIQDALHGLRRACDASWAGDKFVKDVGRLFERLQDARLERERYRKARLVLVQALAEYHYSHRHTADAIKFYKQVIELSPPADGEHVESILAALYEEAGRIPEALELLEKKLKAKPQDQFLRDRVAGLYVKMGKVDEGVEVLGPQQDPHRILALAEKLYRARYLPQAEALVNRIADKDVEARILLARIYTEQKKFGEAEGLLSGCLAELVKDEMNDHRAFEISEEIAQVHRHRGTLREAIARVGKDMENPDMKPGDRRRSLILLCQLQRLNEEFAPSLDTLLKYRELAENKDRVNYRIAETGRNALRELLSRYRASEAEALLRNIRERGMEDTWTDCAWYALYTLRFEKQNAEKQLEKMQAEAGDDEARVFSLAQEFEMWDMGDLCDRYCRRVLELKPDRSVYDSNAHIKLGRLAYDNGKFEEAVKHFDEVNASMTERSMGLLNEGHFREIELHARLRAGGDDPKVLVEFLRDPRPQRQLAAARLLGNVGRPEQMQALEALLPDASAELHAAVEQTMTAIRARHAGAAGLDKPIPEETLAETMSKRGRVLWIEKDPSNPDVRWVSVEGKFVLTVTPKTGQIEDYQDALQFLGYKGVSATHVVFSEKVVWVGTNHGLFAYEHEARRWNGYAVNRQHLDVPVTGLKIRDGQVVVSVKLNDGEHTWTFAPATGEWQETPGGGQ